MTIPQAYSDAARMDGCGECGVLLRVVLPMAQARHRRGRAVHLLQRLERLLRPAALHVREPGGLDAVATAWRRSAASTRYEWNLTMAATVLVMVPVIVLFFFAQKRFIEGINSPG